MGTSSKLTDPGSRSGLPKGVEMKRNCPNCNSSNFIDVPALEQCPDCGLECCYRGGGPNDVYERMMRREERNRELEEEKREFEDWGRNNGFW